MVYLAKNHVANMGKLANYLKCLFDFRYLTNKHIERLFIFQYISLHLQVNYEYIHLINYEI
jgi:hypothetical protein